MRCTHVIKELHFESLQLSPASHGNVPWFLPCRWASSEEVNHSCLPSLILPSKGPFLLYSPGPNIILWLPPAQTCSTAATHMKCVTETGDPQVAQSDSRQESCRQPMGQVSQVRKVPQKPPTWLVPGGAPAQLSARLTGTSIGQKLSLKHQRAHCDIQTRKPQWMSVGTRKWFELFRKKIKSIPKVVGVRLQLQEGKTWLRWREGAAWVCCCSCSIALQFGDIKPHRLTTLQFWRWAM